MSGIFFEIHDINTDDILRFKDSRYNKILEEIDSFWSLKEDFKRYGFTHKRGVLLFGQPGCHAKGTEIVMFDGSFKKVEDLQVGDLLMGPDSKSREVLQLVHGEDEMFQITPVKGESFVVNKNHVLHLQPSGKAVSIQSPVNIILDDYINKTTQVVKDRYKLKKSDGIDFSEKDLLIDPYILGLWLGDGTYDRQQLTNIDPEVIEEWINFGQSLNLRVARWRSPNSYSLVNKKGNKNIFREMLRKLNLLGNKHIPLDYLYSSKYQRLELLAGLIDTDGYSAHSCMNFTNKNKNLADGVVFLARSLGLAAYISILEKGCWVQDHYFKGKYFSVSISGDLSIVPVRIKRKYCLERKQIKDVTRTGFSVKSLGLGEYYGFVSDKDHLYLTSDFIIHHNSGKSAMLKLAMEETVNKGNLVFITKNASKLVEAIQTIREVEPDRKILVVIEDIDEIVRYDEHAILELFDGDSQTDNVLFLATTNYIDRLPPRILRASRFDRKIEVGNPPIEGRYEYLKAKLKEHVEDIKIHELAKKTDGFTFAQLREFLISSFCLKQNEDEVIERLNKNLENNLTESKSYDYYLMEKIFLD
jgi:hypothetical protein